MTHKMLSGVVPVSDLFPLLSVMLWFKRLVVFSVQLENIITKDCSNADLFGKDLRQKNKAVSL